METHILFFILAGVLIAVLIGYSIWSARREKSRVFSNTFSTRPPAGAINHDININVLPTLSPQGFSNKPNLTENQPEVVFSPMTEEEAAQEVETSLKNIKISLPEQPSTPKSEPFSYPPAEPEPPVVNMSNVPNVQLQPEIAAEPQTVAEPAEQANAVPNIVSLYVVAAEGQQFNGEQIVQQLEALGFRFGEYHIFHRHLDNAASPVLFSAANMMQPGIFDLAKIDRFSTVGLVFFMHLPSAGNDLVNLRLMLRTVESFAQAVGGFVLNEQHQLFDDASRQAYLLRATQG